MKLTELDLANIPFSTYGSYMALNYIGKDYYTSYIGFSPQVGKDAFVSTPGLYLRSVKSMVQDHNMEMMEFRPMADGTAVEYSIHASYEKIELVTSEGTITFCFHDDKTLLIHGVGKKIGLQVNCCIEGRETYLVPIQWQKGLYYQIMPYCSYHDRFGFFVQHGDLTADTQWDQAHMKCSVCELNCQAAEGEFLIVLHDMRLGAWPDIRNDYDFEVSLRQSERRFEEFYAKTPPLFPEYEEVKKLASYICWSSVVSPLDFIKRDTMLMTKNILCYSWAFEIWLCALSLSETDKDLAYDQLMSLFDHQNAYGGIPQFINDTTHNDSFQMPPNIGWVLLKMFDRGIPFSTEQLNELYCKISAYTHYWLNFMDDDSDGICGYHHPCDSSNDNSTVFRKTAGVTTPDLSTYLILQMDALKLLAQKTGRRYEEKYWDKLADTTTQKLLDTLFDEDHLPFALGTYTREKIYASTPFLYTPLMLGSRLPAAYREAMITALKSGNYITEYGLASEDLQSKYYESNGFFRGPVWWTQILSTVDGLKNCGEEALSKELARKYMDLAKNSGVMAECYEATTGKPLCNLGYVSTAATFMILGRFYLS